MEKLQRFDNHIPRCLQSGVDGLKNRGFGKLPGPTGGQQKSAENLTASWRSVATLVSPYLAKKDKVTVASLNKEWRFWELYPDTAINPPRDPMRSRFRGFGKRSPLLCTRHDVVSPYLAWHHCWEFLNMNDRSNLTLSYPVMEAYAKLRLSAVRRSVGCLRDARPQPTGRPIDRERVWLMGCALLRFHFNYGDMIRWIGGEYTNAHRNWQATFEKVEEIKSLAVPPGYPKLDYDRAHRICTEGVPLAGIYECSLKSMLQRNAYDNHPALRAQHEQVLKKLTEEEENSFHLLLPRFLCRFIFGLHLSPLAFIVRKGKGRICVDCSSALDIKDDGAPNAQIPRPSTLGREDENPTVYFASALRRHLEWIWNLRISHPSEDILQYGDDIHAAFRHVLYHPDMAIVFAYVFMQFLIIPVGAIFGARNSPSYWCILAEIRAHLTACGKNAEDITPLASRVTIVPPPTILEASRLVPARQDSIHKGVEPVMRDRHQQSMYVDDSATAALRNKIRQSINASVEAAYTLFGRPEENRRSSCLAADKWRDVASYKMEHLGFIIDTRSMTMSWPVLKRQSLRVLIEEGWQQYPCEKSPREVAQILGIIRSACQVAPLGNFLSIRLQQSLSDAISRSQQGCSKRWWAYGRFPIPRQAFDDVRLIYEALDEDDDSRTWSQHIGLLVRREPTSTIYSDASYEGMGGFSAEFHFMWRLSRYDLIAYGFDMKIVQHDTSEPAATADGIHINVLEFLAIIINVVFALQFARRNGPIPGGHVISVLADNTSALSWMRFASRSHSPVVNRLAYFLSTISLFPQVPFKIVGAHIAGRLNVEADALSRFTPFPTWTSVTEECFQLRQCQAYRVQPELMLALSSATSSQWTGESFVQPMMRLLTRDPVTLRTGCDGSGTATSSSKRSHRTKSSRP